MVLYWMAGLVLLLQQAILPDSLYVDHDGQNLAIIERSQYTLPFPGITVIDDVKMNKLIQNLDKRLYQAPLNASLDGQGRMVAEQDGYKLDQHAFTEQVYSYLFGSDVSKVEVPRLKLFPKVDSELLASIREKQIGQYATFFNSNNKNRTNNIALATKAIDNYVVFPGELFSFNQVVGMRTEEKGYMRAAVIVRGELSEGIGGGICQVSSTLFNAADRAGLHIVQRYSHSRNVPYVPSGRDATVSWYGADFSFENNYNQPLLIRAQTYGGTVNVKIYSSDTLEYKLRNVPNASNDLPEEIMDRNVNHYIDP
ncbi:MAG: VanW family protein [Candidatus Pristimantibacillus sp.]